LTDNIPQYAQRFVQEKLTKESRFALPSEQTNRRLSILPASLGGCLLKRAVTFLIVQGGLLSQSPFPYLRWGLFLVDPSYAKIGEYDTAVIAMHLGNRVLYRFDFS
jgi:hypothetical protein